MANQFIRSGGVDLNLLAELAKMEELNRAEQIASRNAIPKAIIGGATQFGQGMIEAKTDRQRIEAEQAQAQADRRVIGEKAAVQYGGPGQYSVAGVPLSKPGEEEKIKTSIQTRPSGTYGITFGKEGFRSEIIPGVPGVRLSETSWFLNLQDRAERDRIALAEAAYDRDYKAFVDRNKTRSGKIKVPFGTTIEDYYRNYGVKNIPVANEPTSGGSPDNPVR